MLHTSLTYTLLGIETNIYYIYTQSGVMREDNYIGNYVRYRRGQLGLTQEDLAHKAGVGLRFLRELEQGKPSLRMDKITQVLQLFGAKIGSPIPENRLDPYFILLRHQGKAVRLLLRNKITKIGILTEPIDNGMGISAWKFVSHLNSKAYRKTKDQNLLEEIRHAEIQEIEQLQL